MPNYASTVLQSCVSINISNLESYLIYAIKILPALHRFYSHKIFMEKKHKLFTQTPLFVW